MNALEALRKLKHQTAIQLMILDVYYQGLVNKDDDQIVLANGAAEELAAKDAGIAELEMALAKSDPWNQISTEPSVEFECIHCGNKYDMLKTLVENHVPDCVWLVVQKAGTS